MKKGVFSLFFLLLVLHGLGQQKKNANLSYQEIIKESDYAFQKALWFQNMPQYNEDSTRIYFDTAEKLLKIHLNLNNKKLAEIYLAKCNYISRIYDYNKMDSVANIGYKYLREVVKNKDDVTLQYPYLFNWAILKLEKGDYKEALRLYTKALSFVDDTTNEKLYYSILRDKGIFYSRYNLDNERSISLRNLKKAQGFYLRDGTAKNAITLYSINREMIRYHTSVFGNGDSVYYQFNQLHKLLNYLKNPNFHAWYYCTYGRELITSPKQGLKTISKEQYEKGRKSVLKALEILNKYHIKSTTIEPYCYGLLADLYLKNGQFNNAISYYKLSRKYYLVVSSKYAAEDMLGYISKAFEQNGDLDSALKYQKQYYTESVSFEKEKNQRSLREHELQVNVMQQDKALNQKQNQVVIYIVLLAIGFLIFIFLVWNYQIKQKNNRLLERMNDDLKSKNISLDKKNEENELLMREIHHRVKNNLEIVSGLLALQSAQISDLNTKEAIIQGQNRVNSISIVHQKLYQGTQLGAIEMKDYFHNLCESIMDSFGVEEQVTLQLDMNKLDLDIDTAIPLGLIVNELFTNAIKYAFPNKIAGNIIIKLEKQSNMFFLNFRDDGIGKTDDVKGTGFGSQLIDLLTRQLNGKMEITNQNGTSVNFHFKLKA